MYVDAV